MPLKTLGKGSLGKGRGEHAPFRIYNFPFKYYDTAKEKKKKEKKSSSIVKKCYPKENVQNQWSIFSRTTSDSTMSQKR